MALKLITTISKKIPLPGLEFSSCQASCTIEGEVTDLNQAPAEARRLYLLAENAVDQQLCLHSTNDHPQPIRSGPAQGVSPSRASAPSPSANRSAPRRNPPMVTDSQLRLLHRLLDNQPDLITHHCRRHGVECLEDLTVSQASGLIDALKAPA